MAAPARTTVPVEGHRTATVASAAHREDAPTASG